MLGYNRTITLTNTDVLLKIWPGVGGKKEQKRKKVAAFPTLSTMIVGPDRAQWNKIFIGIFWRTLHVFCFVFVVVVVLLLAVHRRMS